MWKRLTEAAPTIRDAEERRQATLLASLLLLITPLPFFYLVWRSILDGRLVPSPIAFIGIVALVLAYFLSRTRFYRLGVALAVCDMSVTLFVIAIAGYDPAGLPALLSYMVLGVVIASALLSLRGTLLVVAANLVLTTLLYLLIPEFRLTDARYALSFQVILSTAVVVVKHHRDLLETYRKFELAYERDLLTALMDNIPDAIFFKDTEGRWTRVNRAGARGMGAASPESMIGKSMFDYFALEFAQKAHAVDLEIVASGKPVMGRIEKAIAEDREDLWLSTTKMPIKDDSGQVIGIVGISRDITQLKLAEEKLRENEERLRILFESSPDAIVLLDPHDEDVSWPIVDCNRKFCEMNGFTRDELIGQSIDIVHPPLAGEAERQAHMDERVVYLEQLHREGTFVREVEHRDKSGERVVLATSTTLVTIEGRELVLGVDHDVTDIKLAEEKLRESEERYRLLINGIDAGVVVHAPDTSIRFSNARAAEMLGLSADEMTGKIAADPEWRFVRDDRTPMPVEEYPVSRVIATQEVVENLVVGIQNPDSADPVWGLVNAYPVFDTGGSLNHVTVTFVDISELVEAEGKLRANTERLEIMHAIDRAILSAELPEKVVEKAMRHMQKLVPFFRASLALFDFEAGEFRIMAAISDVETQIGAGASGPLEAFGVDVKLLRSGKTRTVEDIMRLDPVPSASEQLYEEGIRAYMTVPLMARGVLIGSLNIAKDETGPFEHEQRLIARDVADQLAIVIQNARLYDELESYSQMLEQTVEQRTDELWQAKLRVEAILNSVGEALMVVDAEGKVRQVNPAFEEQTGFRLVEMVGEHPRALAPDEQPLSGGLFEAMGAVREGRPWQGELVVSRKDRSVYDAAVTVAPIRGRGNADGHAVVSLRDISEHKQVERMKDAFVSNVSHELRTPITGLGIHLDLLERAVPPDVREKYMPTLLRESERLSRIVEDVLRLSRFDQGRAEMQCVPVELNGLVGQYVDDRCPMAEERGLSLTFEGCPDVPAVEADAGLLSQVLGILVTNALNYTPAGGAVTTCTQTMENGNGRWAGFSVSDTGRGIPPGERDQLFRRFYRGSAGRESDMPGNGLGLAIAREIVSRHGGRIEVDSKGVPGQGATFTVWLPAP